VKSQTLTPRLTIKAQKDSRKTKTPAWGVFVLWEEKEFMPSSSLPSPSSSLP